MQTGCASNAQQGAISFAQNAFESRDYGKCAKELTSAESYGSYSRRVDAQILFLKAICFERMGEKGSSQLALEKIISLYPETDWAAAASKKLSGIGCVTP